MVIYLAIMAAIVCFFIALDLALAAVFSWFKENGTIILAVIIAIIGVIITYHLVKAIIKQLKENKHYAEERRLEEERLAKEKAKQDEEMAKQLAEEAANAKKIAEYRNTTKVKKMAEMLALQYIEILNRLSRDIRTPKLHENYILGYDSNGIWHKIPGNYLINFKEENFSITENELYFLTIAIAQEAKCIIRENYPKDKSGTDYVLQIVSGAKRCRLFYTAPNGFYQAPKNLDEWF